MACYSIVTLDTNVRAAPEEIAEAARAMGLKVLASSINQVDCEGAIFARSGADSPWIASSAAGFDEGRFRREVARAKALAEARRQGCRVIREERQGDRIMIRLQVR